MPDFRVGSLVGSAAGGRPDLLAPSTFAALTAAAWSEAVGVVEIDPAVSDTAASRDAFGLDGDQLANCVIVGGRREGQDRFAACVVLSTTRADVNNTVRRRLDVRKASFLPMDDAMARTGMEYGGITPIGLPADWPVLVDSRVVEIDAVVIGSGVRRSKLLIPGRLLAGLPTAEVVSGLGTAVR